MKSASIPPLRVDPALRAAAESVLREGESLSAFVESSLRAQIEHRRTRAEFIARGLAAREDARKTGVYHIADDVLGMLKRKLEAAKASGRK
ncbi:prevent-host-death protein [Rhizobium sp. CNPSo 3968]|uniref:YlcI/YnfO family protein n=1 Tax=Rhizobium sp. CNPSo 3968 TaxID=3021408 RepID=UPI0025509FD5|nr:YlcI/YnfO family protein [Rhizobium sp. CNPSo 3968]MDK4722120.1 prevent-host-death protein [Rhizobium sp. CNPSo 3968]